MEITSRFQESRNPSPKNSPNSYVSSPNNSNGSVLQIPTPPQTPKTASRSETSNPYPTTFVQADTSTFKQVVQMLTGSPETSKQQPPISAADPPPPSQSTKFSIPPIKTAPKKPGFKLFERRNSLKNGFFISPLVPRFHGQNSGVSPRNTPPEILSPSILDFPSLVLSPVTPLIEDRFNKSSTPIGNSLEEEKAIAEKKFYLHPSPRRTPRDSEPQLLPLFPVTSPRV